MHLRLEAVEEGYHADGSDDGRDGCDFRPIGPEKITLGFGLWLLIVAA